MKMMQKLLLLFTFIFVLTSFVACKKQNDGNNDNNQNDSQPPVHTCSFSEWQTVSEPDCDSIGLRERECSCGEVESEEIEALGHDFSSGYFFLENDVAFYCLECVRTGCSASDTVTANCTTTCQIEPSCEQEGVYTKNWYVKVNGKDISSTEVYNVSALGHDFDEGTWVWNDDYTASYSVSCKRDSTHAVSYEATVSVSGNAATCTNVGYSSYTARVTVNGITYADVKTVALPKLGHSYDYDNIAWVWNGYDSASYTVTCKNDPSHKIIGSSLVQHTTTGDVCESGIKDVYTVSANIDGTVYTDTKEITTEPQGHSYDAENAVWTWYDSGEKVELTLTCASDPSHTVTVEAEVSLTVSTQPTCQSGGLGHGVAVAVVDGVEYTDECDLNLNPLEHELDYESAYWVWDGTESAMLYIPCTLGEGHLEEYYAEVTESYLAPTCETDGYEKHTATAYLFIGEATDEKTEVFPATGHDYELSKVEWLGDDISGAKIYLVCNNDPSHEYDDLDVCDHEIIENATCTKDGLMRHYASIVYNGVTYSAECESALLHTGHTFGATVCEVCGDPVYSEGLAYELLADGSGYAVSGIGSCTDKIISIPNMYNSLPVKEIKTEAFYNKTDIKGVHISEYTVKIGSYAFNGCSSLEYIDFSDAVCELGMNAFAYCTSLTEINLSDGIYKLRENAFAGCTSVVSVRLGSGLVDIYDYAFSGLAGLREIELPEGLKYIGSGAFARCTSLISVTLPESLEAMSDFAFNECYRLVEIKNLSSVEILYGENTTDVSNKHYRFYLKNVYTSDEGESCLWTTPDGFVFYENGEECYLVAYRGTSTDIILPSDCNGKNYELYYYSMSDVNFGDGYLYIPLAVTRIYGYAFYNNETLMVVDGGESVAQIDGKAFGNCTELLSFTFGAGLISINKISTTAFEGCTRLYDVINHSSVALTKGEFVAYYAIEVVSDATVTESNIHFTDDGFIFYLYGDMCYLVGYVGDGDDAIKGQLTLPTHFGGMGYSVYSKAIRAKNDIHSIRIMSGVSSICANAFPYTVDEIYIAGDSGLERLEDEALASTSITSIYIPVSMKYIGAEALPETIESVEFGTTENWRGNHGLLGDEVVKPESISDPEDAAAFLNRNRKYYFYYSPSE